MHSVRCNRHSNCKTTEDIQNDDHKIDRRVSEKWKFLKTKADWMLDNEWF